MRLSKQQSAGQRQAKKLIKVIKFGRDGLIPAVIQDQRTKQVLTLCYLNRAALSKSLETGSVYVYRRSQRRIMLKGETSGHIQAIRAVYVDCEGKSIVFVVKQRVAGCHAGYFSCYFRKLSGKGALELCFSKVFDPARVYRKG